MAGAQDSGEVGQAAGDGSVGAKGQREGPRERLLRLGPAALTDPELLAVLLGSGFRGNPVQALAESLLRAGGGLKALVQHDPQELCALRGLGPARAAQVLAALELGRRVQRSGEARPRLRTPEEIYRYLLPSLAALRKEVFHVLSLNARNVLVQDSRIAEGTMNQCPVDPREVFTAALRAKASAIVLAHNHPSGDANPSGQDLAMTRQLCAAGRLLGIKVLDHLVLGDGTYTSMLESGQLARWDVGGEPWQAVAGWRSSRR
jgi:DNA repair protein RadC